MTASDGSVSAAGKDRTGRRFRILIGVVIAIVLLWTGGWFAARHYVTGKIAAIEARAVAEGATLSCGEQTIGGFPFRLGVTCMKLAASCPAEEASLDLAGFEAMGLLYNPGHALFAAKGPLQLQGPDGIKANADWSSLESSLRVGFSGLKRYSLVADALDARLEAPGRLDAPASAKADHAELHLVADPDAADRIDIFATVANGSAVLPGRPALPPVNADMEIDVPRAMLARRGDALDAWIASGQPVQIRRLVLDVSGVGVALAGDATVDAAGLLSGEFTVRLASLDKLPALLDQIRPGSGDRLASILGPASMMLRPVSVDGRDWREARITVRSGRAALGFLPLGRIPPLRRIPGTPAPAAPPPAAAPAEEAAAPSAPAMPAAPVTSTEPPAIQPAPSPSPAPAAAVASGSGAAEAIRDLAGTLKRAGRCGIAGS